jgi:hypothetical protein
MDFLKNCAAARIELEQMEELDTRRDQHYIGHYVPFGVPAKLTVTYDVSARDYISYKIELGRDGEWDLVEDGEGIDIPESILKLAKMAEPTKRGRKGYKWSELDTTIDVVFHMIYTDPNNDEAVPLSAESFNEIFYTIVMVSWFNEDEGHFYLPNKWWCDARIMSPNLRVYNTLDFSTHPMEIIDLSNELFNQYRKSNPLVRLVGSNEILKLRAEGGMSGNNYLFIPADNFLRQRTNLWLYETTSSAQAQ